MQSMKSELRRLEEWGARPAYGIARVPGDEMFYWQLLLEFKDSRDIDILHILMSQNDYQNAFLVAHSMKGASLSLSLFPLTEVLAQLVEQLRPCYERGRTRPVTEDEKTQIEEKMDLVEKEWDRFERLVGMNM